MTSAEEYLPTENGNGNGHSNGNGNGNGNGHGKIFTLKPALDPATQAIIESREYAHRDPRLTRSMCAFYDELLDLALNPSYYMPHPRGVVTISDTFFAEVFRVSNRTIYTWKKTIEACDYVWLTQQYRKNMWPITTYHLTCLHRPPRTKTDRDGTYGSAGVGRQPPANPGLGARKPGQPGLPLPGSRRKPPNPKSADLQGISAESRNPLRVSAEANFGSEPKPASGESRNPLRARAEANFGREPKPISGESRNPLRARPEADFQHIESQKGDGEVLETPLPDSLGVQRGLTALKRKGGEESFLREVAATLERWSPSKAAKEMKERGGWWRNRFRESSEKAWRVLAEVGNAIKEGTVHDHPGKMAFDLWERWPAPLTKGGTR